MFSQVPIFRIMDNYGLLINPRDLAVLPCRPLEFVLQLINLTLQIKESKLHYVSDLNTVRGLTRGRMLISEFCTAWLQSDQSNLHICNSEIKQRQLGNQAAPT